MDLSSGVAGLLLGAVAGLALTVLFEDALKNARSAVARRIRHVRARGALPNPKSEFRLGSLQTTVLIVEGDGQHVIDEQAIRVIVDPHEVELPSDIALLREEIAAQQSERQLSGHHAHWNGPTYAVAGLTVQRLGIDESPGVTLRLKSTDYFTFLATQELDRVLPDGTTLRRKYLDANPPAQAPDFMSTSFGTYVAVITADHWAVFSKRSSSVGVFPGRWDASTNEALSRSLDSHGRTPPNLYQVARRGLAEELALDPSEYRLELLAFDLDRRTNQWGCMFVAFLHDLTAAQLTDRQTRGVPDKWEHDAIELVRFTIPEIVQHLLRTDRLDQWTPTAPPLYYLALVRRYGRGKVERELGRAIRYAGGAGSNR
jgi:hypothetical protein